MMPLYVLGHFLGDEWVRQHLFESGFLKPPPPELDRPKHQLLADIGGAQQVDADAITSETRSSGTHDLQAIGEAIQDKRIVIGLILPLCMPSSPPKSDWRRLGVRQVSSPELSTAGHLAPLPLPT